MRLTKVFVEEETDSLRLCGTVERAATGSFNLYFQFPAAYGPFVSRSADAFATAMLVPAMHAGEPLEILAPVSSGLGFNLGRIRDVFHTWYPELHRIAIQTPDESAVPEGRGRSAGSFFSGGVDSFFTTLKYLESERLPAPLTHTIFMRGIETELDRTRGIDDSARHANQVASALGIDCIVGETNLRSHFRMDWEKHYFGSALAATGLALGRGLSHICIPSSYSYRDMTPIGSTPLVDEMFSNGSIRILHDGAATPRPEKIASIVGWKRDLVLSHLRVCSRNFGGAFNCGECYKCVRTAIPLQVIGALEGSSLFENRSSDHWGRITVTDHLSLIEENLAFAEQRNADPELVELLRRITRRRRSRAALRTFVRNTPLKHLLWLAPRRWQRE